MPLVLSGVEAEVQAAIRRAKRQAKDRYARECQLALDYLEGDQIQDTRAQIRQRYKRRQEGSMAGQEIMPIVLPLVARFADEAASIWTKPVSYELVDESGEKNDELSAAYEKMLERASYFEVMQELHRRIITLRAAGVWHQWAHGGPRPQVFHAGDIYPIADRSPVGMSPADQRDYVGFAVETMWSEADVGRADAHTFAALFDESTVYYQGASASEPERVIEEEDNPYRWMHADGEVRPGKMFSVWHHRRPLDSLFPGAVSPVVLGNRELNVMFSLLLDIVRWQAYGVPVLMVNHANELAARRQWGPHQAIVLQAGVGEAADMLQAASNYSQMLEILRFFVAQLAWSERMSASDLDLLGEGASITSGFSKLVESLPKIDAREDQLRRLTILEEQHSGPRNIAMAVQHGAEGFDESALRHRVRVKFGGVRFPETEDERAKRYETDTKYGFEDAASLLMQRDGITREEAEEIVARNLANKAAIQPPQQQQPAFGQPGQFGGGMFAQLAAQRSGRRQPEENQDEDEQ